MKIQNIIEKKTDLKERLELISKYSNNSLVRNLSVPEKLFLYETKRIFDIHYFNTKPAHALFLDTKFKIKYICDTEFSREERNLDVEKIVEIMKEKNIVAEEVYELENSEEQIRFELFKVIQNNFVISKCENCGRLDKGAISISESTVSAIRYIVMAPAKKLFSFSLKDESLNELKLVSKLYFDDKLER